MTKSPPTVSAVAVATILAFLCAETSFSAPITWIGGNGTWSNLDSNWSPGDEPDTNDDVVLSSASTVLYGIATALPSDSVQSLTLSGGARLDTNGNKLTVTDGILASGLGQVTLGGAGTTLTVGGATSQLAAEGITINSGATLRIDGGTISQIEDEGDGRLTVNPGGTLTGYGTILLQDTGVAGNAALFVLADGTLTVASGNSAADPASSAAATLQIVLSDPNARVDLDNGHNSTINISRNDTLQIVGTSHGAMDPYSGILNLAEGATINMGAAWQTDDAIIDVNTEGTVPGTAGAAATIAGAAVTFDGGIVTLDAIDTLRFSAPLNFVSGIISNAGLIVFNTSSTIGADAHFQMNGATASLTVSSGVTVNINQAGFNAGGDGESSNIITINSGGVLNLGAGAGDAFNSTVRLNGGELRGAVVTNSGWITGNGLVSSPVSNGGTIQAENIGTLIVSAASNDNDWDGSGGGSLRALSGDLEIRDNAAFPFTGNVTVYSGYQVYAKGFALDFDPDSSIEFHGGTYRGTGAIDIGGTLAATTEGEATLQADDTITFESGSSTSLGSPLRLDAPLTVVQTGADFSGTGPLVNPVNCTLRLADGIVATDFNASVRNEGTLQLGAAGTDGQARARTFQQTPTGTLPIEIGGTASSAFDRLDLTGTAALGGTLDLSFINGFIPAAGQTFTILTAPGGVSGTFSNVIHPASLPADTAILVSYGASAVQVSVVGTTPYDVWMRTFPSIANPAHQSKSADPDQDGAINLAEFALDGNPATRTGNARLFAKIAPVAGVNALTLTLPVRDGTTADPADPVGGELALKQSSDGLTYKIQASDDLASWTLDVIEVTGSDATAIQSGLPAPDPGWTSRTFRSPGPVAGDPREYMRVKIGN